IRRQHFGTALPERERLRVDAEEIGWLGHGGPPPGFVGTRRSNSYAMAENRALEKPWKPRHSYVSRLPARAWKMRRNAFRTVARRKTVGLPKPRPRGPRKTAARRAWHVPCSCRRARQGCARRSMNDL